MAYQNSSAGNWREELCSIGMRISSGLLSPEDGDLELMEFIFRNRQLFRLSRMDEDSFSDFLLHLKGRLSAAVKQFRWGGDAAFPTFLFGVVANARRQWLRQRFREDSAREGAYAGAGILYEETEERYMQCEAPEAMEEDTAAPDGALPLRMSAAPVSRRVNTCYWQAQAARIRREVILIYALKSCALLTEELTERIVRETGIDGREFRRMCEHLQEGLAAKGRRRSLCERTRDNAWYYRGMYAALLSALPAGSGKAEVLSRKLRAKDSSWRRANELLSTRLMSLTPTTKAVAQELGLGVRHVQRMMEAAERNIDILSANRYHAGNEDILGHRKPEQKAGNAGNFPAASYRDAGRRRNSL